MAKLISTKHLVLALIRNDLLSSKLISMANSKGMPASEYFLNLDELVFSLMDLKPTKKNDAVYEAYNKMVQEAIKADLTLNPALLDEVARRIYRRLRELGV